MFGETLPLPFRLLQVSLDRQDCASLFHQRCAFRIFRPVIPQEDCSSVPVMLQLLHVSLIFSQSFPRAGHGKQHCPHAMHSPCSQQDDSWCRTPFSHSVFISSSTDCIRNVFLLLLWRSDLFCSPKDSLTLFHRTIPELFIHIFWISGSSTIWLALQYPWRVWFPPGRLCLWAVFRKFPSTSSFSGLGNSFHTQSPSYSNCLCCSALLLLLLSCASVCFCSSWHWITHSSQCCLPYVTPAWAESSLWSCTTTAETWHSLDIMHISTTWRKTLNLWGLPMLRLDVLTTAKMIQVPPGKYMTQLLSQRVYELCYKPVGQRGSCGSQRYI